MVSRLGEIVLDCADPEALAPFWCAVLGWQVISSTPDVVELFPGPIDQNRLAEIRAGAVVPSLVLVRTDPPKTGKNRAHVDITSVDRSHDHEIHRLLALCGSRVDIGQSGDESWTVLADPAGNEFCVLRSLAPGHYPG